MTNEPIVINFDDGTDDAFTKDEILASNDIAWLEGIIEDILPVIDELNVTASVNKRCGFVNPDFAHVYKLNALVQHWAIKRLKELDAYKPYVDKLTKSLNENALLKQENEELKKLLQDAVIKKVIYND